MNTLLVFATYSGGTQVAADTVAEALKQKGHSVTEKDVASVQFDELNNYDLIVLGSPSWDIGGQGGNPHENFVKFFEANKGKTAPGKKFAVFGLGDSAYPIFCGAVDHLEQFVKDVQGELVTESIRVDGFFFNQQEHTQKLQDWVQKLPQ